MMGTILGLAALGGAAVLLGGLDPRLQVTTYRIKQPTLPKEFDGFRIAHLSDIHCNPASGIVEKVRELLPDIIVITGDLAHDNDSYEPFIRLLDSLLEIAPCYMVSGNHDTWRSDYNTFVEACRSTGGIFLQNQRVELERNGAKIAVSGIEDLFSWDRDTMEQNLSQSFAELGTYDGYEVLLFHRSNLLDLCSNRGFDLILSGHMHGGQFRIPGIGGVLSPRSSFGENASMFFPKYSGGQYNLSETTCIVNRGTGNLKFLPRIYNRPEIGNIILECSL